MSERRLADSFRRLISATGPISLMQFMGESNARYYAGRDALGAEGDFITAPEISQMFGELIGLWLADLWIKAGRTEPVHYVELGPGRGFLARDAQRSMKRYGLVPRIHLVEGSTRLRDEQLKQVPDAIFHDDLSTVPMRGPILLVANEFLDALPIRQLVMTGAGWREVMVDHDGEKFALVAGRQPMDAAVPEARRKAEVGTVLETCPAAAANMLEVAGRLVTQGGAALFIDYGHVDPRFGSTLQAVRAHTKLDPLEAPGEADLTAHVDFDQMKQVALSRGAKWAGTTTQGAWLKALGIDQRADALAEFAPQHREALFSARDRLVDADQMGELFKVMALVGPEWPDAVGFAAS
ncbi:class I SAM-dependent methyltransferase [Alteraurantiacibacter aquimixticola]|uniref:Class I SAM-dependent methyltransferase n=1 Tax=Alteraurantiacibacter aquimixticola TaxID=2489173 RepID=A0A4T3EWP7_9SPHN|nr:SAM-dependent methyltransferase [Alteraurantiacibacter aquimixticola]TIX48903.1 class I SAM-dependent methyltransferase [Alteraurantiacibacter aquimixticola]